jgi:hypothetical protein
MRRIGMMRRRPQAAERKPLGERQLANLLATDLEGRNLALGGARAANRENDMRKIIIGASLALGVAALAGAAAAEPWVDYTPQTEVTQVTSVKVDPNHIDDYITGLKKSWLPGNEIAKKKGLILRYAVYVKMNAADGGPNVNLVIVYPNLAVLDPNQARDQAVEKESLAALPKDKSDALVAGFDKYRTFVGDSFWSPVEFTK